jgi:hypothetical protein
MSKWPRRGHFWYIYASRPFQWHQEHLNAKCFRPCCRTLNIRESGRTPSPQLWECWDSPLHLAKVGLRHTPSQALALVAIPRLRLQHKGWVIMLDLLQNWQITHSDRPSQIAYLTLKEKRFLGLPSDLLIVLLALRMIPIILTMWIFFIHK